MFPSDVFKRGQRFLKHFKEKCCLVFCFKKEKRRKKKTWAKIAVSKYVKIEFLELSHRNILLVPSIFRKKYNFFPFWSIIKSTSTEFWALPVSSALLLVNIELRDPEIRNTNKVLQSLLAQEVCLKIPEILPPSRPHVVSSRRFSANSAYTSWKLFLTFS